MADKTIGEERVRKFVRLTRPHHDRLFRLAMTLCNDSDRAADMAQEALVRGFKAFDRFRPDAPVWPWLARILKNLHLDTVRAGRARFEVSEYQLGTEKASPLDRAPSPSPTPLAMAERSQLKMWLQEELATMHPSQRQVLILCDVEGYSCSEAAELTGIPEGTARSRLHRAREKLRRRLEDRVADRGQLRKEVKC